MPVAMEKENVWLCFLLFLKKKHSHRTNLQKTDYNSLSQIKATNNLSERQNTCWKWDEVKGTSSFWQTWKEFLPNIEELNPCTQREWKNLGWNPLRWKHSCWKLWAQGKKMAPWLRNKYCGERIFEGFYIIPPPIWSPATYMGEHSNQKKEPWEAMLQTPDTPFT